MAAILLDGNALSKKLRAKLTKRVDALKSVGVSPTIVLVCVGVNHEDDLYVSNKIKACESVGISSIIKKYPEDTSQWNIENLIDELNHDDSIHGILVQLPLPDHIDSPAILNSVSLEKDIDSFHLHNIGALATGSSICPPCTPYAVLSLLQEYKIKLERKNAVVIGASLLLAKAIGVMLLNHGATVTVCSTKTVDLPVYIKMADILVSAACRPGFLKGEMIKPGAVVIDVGLKQDKNGHYLGDADFASVSEVAGYLTPVPGGTGPMNITILLMNAIYAAEKISHQSA